MKIIKKSLAWENGTAWLIELNTIKHVKDWDNKVIAKTRYFAVSGVIAPFSGWEVLVFPAKRNGEVINWGDVVGGRDMTHEEAIKELIKKYGD